MRRHTITRLCLSGLAAGLLSSAIGCADDEGGAAAGGPGAPVGGGPAMGGPPGAGPAGKGGRNATLERIMSTLAKGPNSMTPVLGKDLAVDKPDWDVIQGLTKEYARLAGQMGAETPPRGTPESWAKLTGEFAAAAETMNKAAIAKDKAAALAAHQNISNSCKACHQEHRPMGRGGRGGPGMGGPPPGGPGMGGPPPGGPAAGGPGAGGPGAGGPPPGAPPKSPGAQPK